MPLGGVCGEGSQVRRLVCLCVTATCCVETHAVLVQLERRVTAKGRGRGAVGREVEGGKREDRVQTTG
eukprot:3556841-Rhodomonas_salina.1